MLKKVVAILIFVGCGFAAETRSVTVTIPIVSPLGVSTKNLPPAYSGLPYCVDLNATGGTPPYSWGLASGSLPPNVNISNTTDLCPTLTVSLSTGTIAAGMTVTINVAVTVQSGSVQFTAVDASGTHIALGSVSLWNGGASITTSTLGKGTYKIFCTFVAMPGVMGNSSPPVPLTVN